ncbi:MAG: Si-specific NAD(P)(+) transhydrogenase [Opitutales bacterium]|nr:Si-specific NAD(P)(+) transhydrogenase [Opitutales bacterium]
MQEFFDIIVIGSGPGGQRAALAGAKAGKTVCIIEKERNLGGACVHQGTIPSKTLREAALTLAKLKRSSKVFDFSLRKDLEVSTMIDRMDSVIHNYTSVLQDELEKNKITIAKGRARIRSPQTVSVQSVDGRIDYLNCQKLIIATGSRPRHPGNIEIDHEHILDSDSILSMLYLPESLTVIGGGVIGAEYASIFATLGTKVTLIDRAPRPLMFMDPELVSRFLDHLKSTGSRYLGSQTVEKVYWDETASVVTELKNEENVCSEKLLVASGRVANTEGLGIEELGLEQTERGHLVVNDQYETSFPGIYAVGDIIGFPALASCSMEQGRQATGNAIGLKTGVPFEHVPMGIYAVPEMSAVGIDEKTATDRYGEKGVVVGKADFKQVARGQIMGISDGMLKLIAKADTYELIGVHIVGEGATELIHVGEMAMVNNNTVRVFLENILNFPTLAEAYRIAALDILGWK